MKKYSVISLCLLLAYDCMAQSKTDDSDRMSNQLQLFNKTQFQETTYLHVNTSFLVVGESILFTVYCLNANDDRLSDLSTIAYVELINENAVPVLQTKIVLKEGIGFGDFFLPSTLSSGNYSLIAYTKWMRNFSKENFFKTQLTIINPFRKPATPTLSKNEGGVLEFFPEGGKLIANINNTIGFRAVSEKVKGSFSGKVVDEAGNVLVEFSPTFNGMGKFSLLPAMNKEYKIIIIDSLQNVYFQQLPPAFDKGIAMKVTETESAFQILLSSSSDNKNSGATILVHQKFRPIVETRVEFNEMSVSFEIKKLILPSGVSQITVFSNDGLVACERNIFSPGKEPGFDFSLERKNFKTREKVSLKLIPKDNFSANLSISIRRIESKIADNISSSWIMNGNLRREKSAGDLLLLNSNSFYYPIDKLKKKDTISWKYLPEVRGNLLSGTVRKNNELIPAIGEKVYLSVPSKEYLFFVSTTDSSGRFYFNTDKIKFNAEIIIQVDSATCPSCKIISDDSGLEDYSIFKPKELVIDSTFKKLIEQRSFITQIENAYYDQKQDSILDKPNETRFYGKPDETYRLDDYVRFPTMQDVLIEYASEIILRKKGGQFEIRVVNRRKREAFEKDPLILIDGIPIFDLNKIMNYNPLWVEKIEVVGRRYFYGSLETQGIISFTTYDGIGKNISSMKKEKYTRIQPRKKYFSPAYTFKPSALDRIPDYRIQLYWNPSVVVSKRPILVDFFTSDLSGDFEIVAEGIRNDGQLINYREIIHVDK